MTLSWSGEHVWFLALLIFVVGYGAGSAITVLALVFEVWLRSRKG